MKITWFDSVVDGKPKIKEDRSLIMAWVREREEELHKIYHLAMENEMEAVKVISGDQEIDKDGGITLRTIELHFLRGLVLVLRVVEVQEPGSGTTRRAATQLGCLTMPACEDNCGLESPATKKEIK